MGAPLPRAVTDLWFATERLALGPEVDAVRQIAMDAVAAPNPKGALNQGLRRLRSRRTALRRLSCWLDDPVVTAEAEANGAHWALMQWRQAIRAVEAGERPHVAFGMDRAGRPHEQRFTVCDDLAAYLEHRARQGDAVGVVWSQMQVVMKNGMPTAGTLRWARQRLRTLPAPDVAEKARITRDLYGLP